MLPALSDVVREHDPILALTAGLLCVLGCLTTAGLLARAQRSARGRRLVWGLAAAVEFGGSACALHFVAMLGYQPGVAIGYALLPTALSAAVAVLGAAAAFATLLTDGPRVARAVVSAALLTASAGGMHYLGVHAMHVDGTLLIDRARVIWSLGISAGCTLPAMLLATDLSRLGRRLGMSAMLCAAICALHFTGMSALHAICGASHRTGLTGIVGSSVPAAAIAATSVAILSVSLLLTIVDGRLEERLGRERLRLRQLVGVSFEGLLIERNGRILEVNERLAEMAGQPAAAIVGRAVSTLIGRRSESKGAFASGANAGLDRFELIPATGDAIPVELLARDVTFDDRPAKAVAVRDLTARYASEARIRHLALHDALTGLANRALLDEQLDVAIRAAIGSNQQVSVFCLDLDRFKQVNDSFGHGTGDRLLAAVAERLTALVRGNDTVARCGGDEFVMVLAGHDGTHEPILAARIVAELGAPFAIDGQLIEIGTSVGVATFPRDASSGAELLRSGDVAMYQAKQSGKGTFRIFDRAMDEEMRSRRMLEQDIGVAISRGEFSLHYQPLVDCQSGRIEGFEALLRWTHPTRGSVPPAFFIPLAEESGAIGKLGSWVLATACREAATWRADIRVAVNVSSVQFRQPEFADQVLAILAETDLDPSRLEIEITESVLIDDPARAMTVLSRLREAGVLLSLDDFGTGFSSLSYLRNFPFDKIKIDRSFVTGLGDDERSNAIVSAIVTLGHSLDLAVIAEGVETRQQLDILQARRCNQVQGFLLGRPAPGTHVAALVSARVTEAAPRKTSRPDHTTAPAREPVAVAG